MFEKLAAAWGSSAMGGLGPGGKDSRFAVPFLAAASAAGACVSGIVVAADAAAASAIASRSGTPRGRGCASACVAAGVKALGRGISRIAGPFKRVGGCVVGALWLRRCRGGCAVVASVLRADRCIDSHEGDVRTGAPCRGMRAAIVHGSAVVEERWSLGTRAHGDDAQTRSAENT